MKDERKATGLAAELRNQEFRKEFAHEWLIEHFLEAVSREMVNNDVSKTELAARMGVALSSVSRTMSGTMNVTTRTMANMALALNLLVSPELESVPGVELCYEPQVVQLTQEQSAVTLHTDIQGGSAPPAEAFPGLAA